ncbi:AraC family transcriptional regulator [Pseudomonas alkylphenolica]|uniref:AraC family transcriptional regulator n=1 Tax=Pseudomonas alkylphenolica TaxID=237609 RepID=A0A443ZJA6_9PSED|nr:AraC family transcriptional regulator [Pseudomonas alkylphenolica]RWU19019.1 AraC family transcriptional regulator [Pseudomonas alkylphenolica]
MYSSPTRKPIILRADVMNSDVFEAMFAQLFGNLYADTPPLPNDIVIGGVYGRYEGVSFRHMHYQGDFTITLPSPADEITFVLPIAGKIIVNQASDSVGSSHVGLAIDKREMHSMRVVDGHSQHGLSIRRSLLTERLSLLLGKPIVQALRFEPRVNLDVPALQGIRALVQLATGNDFDLLINTGSLMPVRLQEMLIDAVLEAWPHNFTEALRRPAPRIAPRHVKVAMDYIHSHPQQRVGSSELAQLSNTSLRALQDGFQRFAGTSIVAYQRQVRLEQAYTALASDGAPSVSEVALQHGFSNVGRFCQYFQGAYGVSPADVRKRPTLCIGSRSPG